MFWCHIATVVVLSPTVHYSPASMDRCWGVACKGRYCSQYLHSTSNQFARLVPVHMQPFHNTVIDAAPGQPRAMTGTFRFANYYGDHMVLQRGPHSAIVWGYIPECDPVMVTFNGKTISASLVTDAAGGCRWKATLPPTTGKFIN